MRRLLYVMMLCGLPLSQAWCADTTTIAALGDSLFSGFGIALQEAMPAQLEKNLLSAGYNVRVINDGIAGDTSAGGLARIDKVIVQKPDIVILELGANDMVRGIDPAITRATLDKIIARFRELHIQIIVVGQKGLHSLGEAYTSKYNPMFCDLAKQYQAPCYAFFYEGIYDHPELLQKDGIHPNAAGAKIVADNLTPMVEKLLKK